tara:strand:+ start:522 stop:1064 length:543 start_codon:yes stop_codon:yes gene_type:complete
MSTLTVQNIQGSASSSNTISVASGHVLTQPGSVIQTLNATTATGITTTSGTLADVGLSVTITPKFATSKIMVFYTVSFYILGGGNDSNFSVLLVRNINGGSFSTLDAGTDNNGTSSAYIQSSAGNCEMAGRYTDMFTDSPSTTNACIYKLQGSAAAAGGQVYLGTLGGSNNHMIVQEIAQ